MRHQEIASCKVNLPGTTQRAQTSRRRRQDASYVNMPYGIFIICGSKQEFSSRICFSFLAIWHIPLACRLHGSARALLTIECKASSKTGSGEDPIKKHGGALIASNNCDYLCTTLCFKSKRLKLQKKSKHLQACALDSAWKVESAE